MLGSALCPGMKTPWEEMDPVPPFRWICSTSTVRKPRTWKPGEVTGTWLGKCQHASPEKQTAWGGEEKEAHRMQASSLRILKTSARGRSSCGISVHFEGLGQCKLPVEQILESRMIFPGSLSVYSGHISQGWRGMTSALPSPFVSEMLAFKQKHLSLRAGRILIFAW